MDWMLMPLRRYADFSGRSRRMEFWMWKVFMLLIGAAFWVLLLIIGGAAMMSGGDVNSMMAAGGGAIIVMGLYFLVMLAFFIPDLAVTVRRLHDTNRSGWWILAPLAPYLVLFVVILGGAASGSQGGMAAAGIIGLVLMLAVIGLAITLLVFMFLEGTPGPNRFGPDPKAAERAQYQSYATPTA